MKNKFFYLIAVLVILTVFSKNLVSDEMEIKTSEINILDDGKLLTGKNGFNIVSSTNIKITGNEFIYNKETQELNAKGNIIINDKDRTIKIICTSNSSSVSAIVIAAGGASSAICCTAPASDIAITGVPHANASSAAFGIPSQRDGNKNASAPA